MENLNLHDPLTVEESFAKREYREGYIKPTCEVIEIDTMEMLAASGEGSDTEGDYEFGERTGFTNERNRGEWGDLWK